MVQLYGLKCTRERQEAAPKTPARRGGNAALEGNKENSQSTVGPYGTEHEAGCEAQEPLSGRKRGGEQIAKQKSFSGSYFQVIHSMRMRRALPPAPARPREAAEALADWPGFHLASGPWRPSAYLSV